MDDHNPARGRAWGGAPPRKGDFLGDRTVQNAVKEPQNGAQEARTGAPWMEGVARRGDATSRGGSRGA